MTSTSTRKLIERTALVLTVFGLAVFPGGSADPGDVVALVGHETISNLTVQTSAAQLLNRRYYHRKVSPDRLAALSVDALKTIIETKLLSFAARDRGFELPLERAEAARKEMERRIGKESYIQSIRALGWNREDHAHALAEDILAKFVRRCFIEEPAGVSERDAAAYYESHEDAYREPPSQHLEHMLIGLAPNATKEDQEAARDKADRILRELASNGSFGDLAYNFSTVASRVKGGDLGWVHKGQLQEPVEGAAWSAEVGKVVGPISSTDGFHIIKVLDRRPARQLSFREAVRKIQSELGRKRETEVRRSLYEETAKRHPVVVLDEKLMPAADEFP